jgi:hypothetical protein
MPQSEIASISISQCAHTAIDCNGTNLRFHLAGNRNPDSAESERRRRTHLERVLVNKVLSQGLVRKHCQARITNCRNGHELKLCINRHKNRLGVHLEGVSSPMNQTGKIAMKSAIGCHFALELAGSPRRPRFGHSTPNQ